MDTPTPQTTPQQDNDQPLIKELVAALTDLRKANDEFEQESGSHIKELEADVTAEEFAFDDTDVELSEVGQEAVADLGSISEDL